MEMVTKTSETVTMAEDPMGAIATDATEEDPTGTVTTNINGKALDLTGHGHHTSSRTMHLSTSVFKTDVSVNGAPNAEKKDSG